MSLLTPYSKLCDSLRTISSLGGCLGTLVYDEYVFMPKGAAESRGRQKAALIEVLHQKSIDPALGQLISDCEKMIEELNPFEKANVRDARRSFNRESRKPPSLARLEALYGTEGYQCWVKARETNNFLIFSPILSKLLSLKKEIASVCEPKMSPFNFAIDLSERGMSSDRIEQLFGIVKSELCGFIKKIDRKLIINPLLSQSNFDLEIQKRLGKDMANRMGFDFNCGRIDSSVHPFTGGASYSDVRMTTRYKEDNLFESLTGIVHECGHSLYEQARSKEHYDLPVSEAVTMGIHESQSLFWERIIGHSLSFSKFLCTLLPKYFPFLSSITPEEYYRFLNQSKASFIRVDADELTYPLHVIMRFEIEKAFFEGSLSVDDLPTMWNTKMKDYLGITPPDDSMGCLQDIHWSDGSFGYFSSYLLGSMFAAQFHEAIIKDIPSFDTLIETGDFLPIKDWLNKHIHTLGSLYPSSEELCIAVTGKPLDPYIFLNYLKKKYSELYGL